MRAGTLGILLAAAVAAAWPATASAFAPACDQTPAPGRWLSAGTPDRGLEPPLIVPHRGGLLAPEETLENYRAALAYGADRFEGDVRRTKDGVLVLSHDETVGRLTGTKGTPQDRKVSDMTLAELKALNTAEYADFALSAPPSPRQAYNPARITTLAEALALAEATGMGMDLDLKETGYEQDVAALASRFPKAYAKTFFEVYPQGVLQMRAVAPDTNVMWNLYGPEPPGFLYALTQPPYSYRYFGSTLEKFTAERIAEIHDGCGIALPHSYDKGDDGEDGELREGRARGTDGAQTNQADVAAAGYGRRVPTRIDLVPAGDRTTLCLRNATNGFGLPYLFVEAADGTRVQTLREGCVVLPSSLDAVPRFTFAGTSAARPSSTARQGAAGVPGADDDDRPIAPTAPPPGRCTDRAAPRSVVTAKRSRASTRGARLAGTAFDLGCPGGVERVDVALGLRVRGGRCRFVSASGALGTPRSCRSPKWRRARGTSTWSLVVAGRLPRGRYVVNTRALDVFGNAEPVRAFSRAALVVA